jgi:hypothetical protein
MCEPIGSQSAVAEGLTHRHIPAAMLAVADAAGPSRRVIVGRPSGPSSLSAALRPRLGLAGLTGPPADRNGTYVMAGMHP